LFKTAILEQVGLTFHQPCGGVTRGLQVANVKGFQQRVIGLGRVACSERSVSRIKVYGGSRCTSASVAPAISGIS
jgi:hypothetical protein